MDSLGNVATDAVVIHVAADVLWVHRSTWDATTPLLPPSLFPCPEYEAIPSGNTAWTESQSVIGYPASKVVFYEVHLHGVPDSRTR